MGKIDRSEIQDDVKQQVNEARKLLQGEDSNVSWGFSVVQDLNRHDLYLELGVMDPTNATEMMETSTTKRYSTHQYDYSTLAAVAAVITHTLHEELPGITMLDYERKKYK